MPHCNVFSNLIRINLACTYFDLCTYLISTDSDLTGLTGDVPEPFEVESYDLKVVPRTKTAGSSRLATAERKIDLRVTVTDGHFNLVAAFGDEWKKSCADWIILDGY